MLNLLVRMPPNDNNFKFKIDTKIEFKIDTTKVYYMTNIWKPIDMQSLDPLSLLNFMHVFKFYGISNFKKLTSPFFGGKCIPLTNQWFLLTLIIPFFDRIDLAMANKRVLKDSIEFLM